MSNVCIDLGRSRQCKALRHEAEQLRNTENVASAESLLPLLAICLLQNSLIVFFLFQRLSFVELLEVDMLQKRTFENNWNRFLEAGCPSCHMSLQGTHS